MSIFGFFSTSNTLHHSAIPSTLPTPPPSLAIEGEQRFVMHDAREGKKKKKTMQAVGFEPTIDLSSGS